MGIEVIMLIIAILLRVAVIACMYNVFIELYKASACTMSYIFVAGFAFYSAYTFGIEISQDLANPIRLVALIGLSLMFGATSQFIRAARKKKL